MLVRVAGFIGEELLVPAADAAVPTHLEGKERERERRHSDIHSHTEICMHFAFGLLLINKNNNI